MRPMGEIEVGRREVDGSWKLYAMWMIYNPQTDRVAGIGEYLNTGMLMGIGFWEALRWTLLDLSDEWGKHGIDWENAPEMPA